MSDDREREGVKRRRELVGQLLDGVLSEAERGEVNELLKSDPEARAYYAAVSRVHAQLYLAYAGGGLQRGMPPAREVQEGRGPWVGAASRGTGWRVWAMAAGILVVFGLGLVLQSRGVSAVATLVSSENAAWESVLPTAPNSRLKPGLLDLKAGMATIRFDSGARVTVEAPARLEILHSMRGRLISGAAIIDAPERARGFVMEAPNSFAVDHGTRFAMAVHGSGRESTFEVLSGEISVHHLGARTAQRLQVSQATTANERGLERTESPFARESVKSVGPSLRIGTGGKTRSITRGQGRQSPSAKFLTLKSTVEQGNSAERRAFLSFDLRGVEAAAYQAVRLRLSLVPSGQGLAVHLPPEIRFQLYGISRERAASLDWSAPWDWEKCPTPDDGEWLGSVEIPRAQQSGSVWIGGKPLRDFLQKHQGEAVVFLIVRETRVTASGSLVHAFATDFHPEAPGPALEFLGSDEAP